MSTFPLDVLGEILCRLPVDCALRCRCVSRSWRALIDSAEFAKLHVKYSVKTNSNLRVMLRKVDYFGYGKRCFYSLDFDSLNSRVVTPKELTNPLMSSEINTKILGSCNGLLLISNTVDEIALWNPSTGKYKKIPVVGITENHVHVNFGFGYDVTNDDYKVVRIVQFSGTEKGSFHSDVKVFSLRSSCWRGVEEELPYYLRYEDQPGTYLNGSLHWIAGAKMETPANKLEPLIVTFDLGTEKWGLVPRPPYTDTGFIVRLVVLGGSLCIYKTYFIDDWENGDLVLDHVDIWVMKEYGIRDSWAMLISLEQPDKYIGHTVLPLANSKSGKELLVEQDNRRFLWTSIEGDSIKIVDTEIGNLRGFLHFNSYIYLGSLVKLSSNDGTSDPKKQLKQEKGGNKKALKKRGDDFLSKGFKLKL